MAAANGHVDDSEIDLVYQMGEVMGMSSAHMKGILGEMEEMPDAPDTQGRPASDGDFV